MNYELKSISPGATFLNALRIFIVVGFIVAVLSFFIIPNPNIRITGFMQRLAAVGLFTVVYGVVVSIVLALIALLYNVWAGKFKGVTFRLEQHS